MCGFYTKNDDQPHNYNDMTWYPNASDGVCK